MAAYTCQPINAPLDAEVTVPGSKSITNRALLCAAIADGTTLLQNVLLAEDTQRMIKALKSLGIPIAVDQDDHVVEVSGCRGLIPEGRARIDCGNAGTVMRFGTALCALGTGQYELDGNPRMRQRPIGPLVDVLRTMGAAIEYLHEEGFPPLVVHANGLTGGHVAFERTDSSQFISALLLAAPYARQDVLIDLAAGAPSIPYVRMTTRVMDAFGVAVVDQYRPDGCKFVIEASQRYRGTTYLIEPDASSATYFLAAPAILGGRVTVNGLGHNSIQGDVGFLNVLEEMGCGAERDADHTTVFAPMDGHLRGIHVDLGDMPDTVQTLAVVALFAEGPTTIRNVANLRVKETDRLTALVTELTRLGATVKERDGGLTIHPPTEVRPATVRTYDDHRMAMSFALAGLKVPGIVIEDPACCAKTFPDFFAEYENLRAQCERE